ncbi:MAG: rhodanese-related sulfurtransferase [Pseudomonadota bacterium]
MSYIVAALYKFAALPNYAAHKTRLEVVCEEAGTKGTLLLAHEGVNGTIAGTREGIDSVLQHLRTLPGCADIEHKEATAHQMPFARMKVRLKKEIVTMGVEGIDPNAAVGTYVAPEDWNDLISDPDVLVIDTRNDYEVGIGTFDGAVNPQTKSFRDFPDWFKRFRETNQKSKVAMFCTGGIRCEKSTAFLKTQGIEDVYHLKGGILKYLETVPEADSKWQGECFVFDGRVSVGHGLEPGSYDQCYACRRPITDADKASPDYVKGVSCPACVHEYSAADRSRFAERQKQIQLARKRGGRHIGASQNTGQSDQ